VEDDRPASGDPVDRLLAQWARERPDVDASPMGVIGRISRLQRRIDAAQRATFARFDLDPPGFDVLATLRRQGAPFALTPGALMRSAMVTSGAITQRLDRLEARGLVARGPHPEDGRGVVVTLTEAGRALVDEVLPAHLATEERLLEALSPADRETLAALLRTLDSPAQTRGVS
jgi:DNA-binding MarR family transcriptional regulator